MLKKTIFTISFLFLCLHITAQKSINDYKYIIVPKQFEFSKSDDQYQLNSILKFLFNKYGYEAYFADETLPEDLNNNRCLALTSKVSKDKSGMFKTKLEIILSDCHGNAIVTSKVGESKIKEFDKAYNQAMRDAFSTFQDLEYKYQASDDMVTKEEDDKTTVQSTVKETKPEAETTPLETITEDTSGHIGEQVYYAQPKKGGYQLVDSEPKVVMFLLSTAANDVFIVKGKSAIVYKEDGFWYYSENNGELKEKILMDIKF